MVRLMNEVNTVNEFERLKQQFLSPPTEFSPIPFWFWNDALTQEEIVRQIHDFHAKEVDGFVIHPRLGLSRDIPYLSEVYFELVRTAVVEADKLGMKVILYDEGMYPSGSACGLVVKQNPEYASRGLMLREFTCAAHSGECEIPVALSMGESIVSAQAVRKLSDGAIDPESTIILDVEDDVVRFTPLAEGSWSVLLFVDTYSGGTIRGVHAGQDDGEPEVPAAADLLNAQAVRTFLAITHEKYYEKLEPYFGKTIIAMFTDEPDLLGRDHVEGMKPWTRDFLPEFLLGGCREKDLPALWFEAGTETAYVRDVFDSAIRDRMSSIYYGQLAEWCVVHGVALTGHPAASDDIGLLEHFHIPGQDVVWRYIAPEEGKALTGAHSTMGKCSSDAARHRRRRRNLNEVFGVCGIDGGWSLSADNMKWYLDWLFVRGVNLIAPHAFYYSIRDERRDERPPDVGPHNIWWPEYAQFSRYIKRMSWLMTDSMNGARVAVLARASSLSWRVAKPLFEHQIEFNYLEEVLLDVSCNYKSGEIQIAGYRYAAVLIEEGERLSLTSWERLHTFCKEGGLVIELLDSDGSVKTKDIGQVRVTQANSIPQELLNHLRMENRLEPACANIRISRVTKAGVSFCVIVNEGEETYEGKLCTTQLGVAELWRPWSGECEVAAAERNGQEQIIFVRIERREALIIAVNPNSGKKEDVDSKLPVRLKKTVIAEMNDGWLITSGPCKGEMKRLESWTQWEDMKHYSGSVTYEKEFQCEPHPSGVRVELNLGEAHELVRVWLNGIALGSRMWSPYVYEVGHTLKPGANVLSIEVTNSLANRYDGKSLPSGLLGPVRLISNSITVTQ
ncbi:glycosylhydrolase-like jelly roll fold domain-containing protein [Paenibacillus sp. strain BS8-2]